MIQNWFRYLPRYKFLRCIMQDFFHIFIVQYLFNHESHSRLTVVFLSFVLFHLLAHDHKLKLSYFCCLTLLLQKRNATHFRGVSLASPIMRLFALCSHLMCTTVREILTNCNILKQNICDYFYTTPPSP